MMCHEVRKVDFVKVHAWSIDVSQLCSLHACSDLPFFKSKAIDPELRDASVLVVCILTGLSEFVVDFVKIVTEVGKV